MEQHDIEKDEKQRSPNFWSRFSNLAVSLCRRHRLLQLLLHPQRRRLNSPTLPARTFRLRFTYNSRKPMWLLPLPLQFCNFLLLLLRFPTFILLPLQSLPCTPSLSINRCELFYIQSLSHVVFLYEFWMEYFWRDLGQ